MSKKSKGMYPDAHSTAPGGMSRKALIAELCDKWDYEPESDWDGTSWPTLIEMVVEERAEAEKTCQCDPEQDAHRPSSVDWCEVPLHDLDADEPDAEDDDLDETVPVHRDPVFRSAKKMFDDEGPDETPDHGGLDIDALLAEIDDEPVLGASTDDYLDGEIDPETEIGKVIADEDGMLDPEALFEEMFAARAEEEAKNPPLFIGIPGVRDYIFDGHAGAGPSGAERWMNCTMSLTASRRFLETLSPNQQKQFAEGTSAARQGTTAHAAGEAKALHMLNRIDDDELDMTLLELTVNPAHETEAFDDEMDDYTGEYVDLIRSYAQERGAEAIELEQRVEAAIPLTGMHEDEVYVIRGSADGSVLPVGKHKSLVVIDLKYGEGIDVDVEANPQIRFYALGVIGAYVDEEGNIPDDFRRIEYIIAQPRLGGIKRWEESIDDLLTWRDEVAAPALTKALYGEAEGATFEPSELACQWCPARGSCPALAESVVASSAGLFEAISEAEYELGPGQFPETASLPPARLAELLAMTEDVDKLRKSLKEEAQRRLHRGESVPGYHLVNYSPPRHWVDDMGETTAEIKGTLAKAGATTAQIKDLFTEPRLISPPAAEKVLGKEGFPNVADLVVKPDPVPVIARVTDRRKAWEGKPPEAMFADETDNT